MRLKITHKSTYQYSKKVFVEPHHFYFYPLPRNYLTLLDFELDVSPASDGLAQRVDAEDNLYHQCWFNEMMDHFTVIATIEIQTDEINPFNFLLEEKTEESHLRALKIFLEGTEISPEMKSWTDELRKNSQDNLVTFLTFINKEINDQWDHETRYEEDLLEPGTCFKRKQGSCRDLSWMMIHMLRSESIPARFVSGYAFNDELGEGHELHAWVEAWVAGAGWIGLDPSAGILATDKYIPIVSSYHPTNTFPIQGTFRGEAVSKLDFEVKIKELE